MMRRCLARQSKKQGNPSRWKIGRETQGRKAIDGLRIKRKLDYSKKGRES
jgi:hypothetical protein